MRHAVRKCPPIVVEMRFLFHLEQYGIGMIAVASDNRRVFVSYEFMTHEQNRNVCFMGTTMRSQCNRTVHG